MKKYILLSCCFLLFTAAWAQSSFEVAYEIANYSYKEPDGNTPISLKGNLQGVSSSFKHRFINGNTFWAADFRYMGGATDYDGWLSGTPPTKSYTDNVGDYYLEGRLHVGSIYALSENVEMWAGLGLGYRYLKDHMNKHPNGYLRQSNYLYVPATVDLHYLSGAWNAVFSAEVDILLAGVQHSRFSDIDPAYSNPTNHQKSGLGVRFSVRINKDLGVVSLFIEPFWRYWEIQDSDTTTLYRNGSAYKYVMEPHNTTQEYGVRAGFAF